MHDFFILYVCMYVCCVRSLSTPTSTVLSVTDIEDESSNAVNSEVH